MIDIKTKVHDRYSIEFKMGFVARRKLPKSDFSVYTWIFVPSSLDINKLTYTKQQFYRDVKSNIRLITPRFLLRDIASSSSEPLRRLRDAMNEFASNPTRTTSKEYEHQAKLFAAIIKSSLRDECNHILSRRKIEEVQNLTMQFTANSKEILASFHSLKGIINVPTVTSEGYQAYAFADEFICDMMARHAMKLLERLDQKAPASAECHALKDFLISLNDYRREEGLPFVDGTDKRQNKDYFYRQGILKKYVEGILFLRADKKKDGVLAEQLLFSIAAGMAMIFATVVAWAFQRHFGNLTWPLFIALIISYMLKDRIKELMRYYFAHKVGSRFFDNKARICYKDKRIGWLKEGVDFISSSKVSPAIKDLRRQNTMIEMENSILDEQVLLYRKSVHIDRKMLDESCVYRLDGVNDIMRLNVHSFLPNMDNPQVPTRVVMPDGHLSLVQLDKVYYLHVILQYTYDNTTEFKHFRIELNRDGIRGIEEMKA